MSDKTEKEQTAFIKEQAKKILDLLVTIAPVQKGVKEIYKVSKETNKALTLADKVERTGQLTSSDGNINRLQSIANQLSNELSSLNRKDENWWIVTSGANLFSQGESASALKYLYREKKKLVALREACTGLKTLTGVAFANTVANVKGLAKLYAPSLPMIDGMVAKEVMREFDVCIGLIDSILKKLEAATLVVADMKEALDKFLLLIEAQDQRSVTKAIRTAEGRP